MNLDWVSIRIDLIPLMTKSLYLFTWIQIEISSFWIEFNPIIIPDWDVNSDWNFIPGSCKGGARYQSGMKNVTGRTRTNNACVFFLTFIDEKMAAKSARASKSSKNSQSNIERWKWNDEKTERFLTEVKAFKRQKLGEGIEWDSDKVVMREQIRVNIASEWQNH